MLDNVAVFDLECNGLNPTKIHCLSATTDVKSKKLRSTTDYNNMRKFFSREDAIVVAHNGTRFDIPVAEKLLGVKFKGRIIDTLALSWYLYPDRKQHGLEAWGEDLGFPKPPVYDWENEPIEVYLERCESDVEINRRLWNKMYNHLQRLYPDEKELDRFLDYIEFKMDCARKQEASRWKLDVPKAKELRDELSIEYEKAIAELRKAMPPKIQVDIKNRPAKFFKLGGAISKAGEKWLALCEEHGKNPDDASIRIETHLEPNPASDPQIKAWLFGLGWEPCTYKYVRDKKTGDIRTIPQVRCKNDDNEPELTPSVLRLVDKEPGVKALERVGLIKHRFDVVKGFLAHVDEEGYIKAEMNGLTNTMRYKHRVIVNLPGVDKPYGAALRGLLVAPEGYELCGSDLSSCEDRTKQHYIYPFDPEYVKEMQRDDFDPHISLALFAGAVSQAQVDEYNDKGGSKEVKKLVKAIRKNYKTVNYACTYNAGGATVARSAGVSEREGMDLVETYWRRNWAIKAFVETLRIKKVSGQDWIQNPVSGFWYSLRKKNDAFSTVNQGTGVYVFDTWLKYTLSKRPQITAQFHDEKVLCIKLGNRDKCRRLILWAIEQTNKELNLNVRCDCDIQFGHAYSDIH